MGRRGRVRCRERSVTNRRYLKFTYTGNIFEDRIQNYPHGHGIAYYKNGAVYEGEFDFGRRHGYGKLTYNDGSIYEGIFIDDTRNGYGTYQCHCGCLYTGSYVNNCRSGDGSYKDPFGNTFKGKFENNLKNGVGTLTYKKDGSQLSGYWKDDTLDNSENIIYRTRDGIYSGKWFIEKKVTRR